MENLTIAKYKGQEYFAGIKVDGRIVLRSDNANDMSQGFQLQQIGKIKKYIKYVSREEIDEIYEVVKKATYKGYTCDVLQESEEQVLIQINNILYETSIELGMDKAVDKGMYVKWINKVETELQVKRTVL